MGDAPVARRDARTDARTGAAQFVRAASGGLREMYPHSPRSGAQVTRTGCQPHNTSVDLRYTSRGYQHLCRGLPVLRGASDRLQLLQGRNRHRVCYNVGHIRTDVDAMTCMGCTTRTGMHPGLVVLGRSTTAAPCTHTAHAPSDGAAQMDVRCSV